MQRNLKLEGRNTAEKLAHIERILQNFQSRLSKTIVGIIPPIPIMHYCAEPVDGIIAKLLIPISGRTTDAYIRIGKYENKPAAIEVTIQSGIHYHTVKFECSRPAHSFEVGWTIHAGDVITVKGEGIGDIHIAFAVQPDMNRTVKERQTIEGFMALLEQDNGSTV